jgi:hypothetical protein
MIRLKADGVMLSTPAPIVIVKQLGVLALA